MHDIIDAEIVATLLKTGASKFSRKKSGSLKFASVPDFFLLDFDAPVLSHAQLKLQLCAVDRPEATTQYLKIQ